MRKGVMYQCTIQREEEEAVKPWNAKFVKLLYHDTTRLKFTDLPIYRIYLCPDAAKFTTLPIYQIYHGPKSGEIYQFTKFTIARRAFSP